MRLFALVLVAALMAACNPESTPLPGGQSANVSQDGLVDGIHAVVVAGSNYDHSQVEVKTLPSQVVVIVTNSNLVGAPHEARDADAERIAHVIEKHLASNPDRPGVVAIHVDYVSGANPPAAAARIVDSMDFRKDHEGHFRKDVS